MIWGSNGHAVFLLIQSQSKSRICPTLVKHQFFFRSWVMGIIRQISTVCLKSVYVQILSNLGPTSNFCRPWVIDNFWQKSTLWPKSVHVQNLSSLCPISNFGISNHQNVNPEHFFPCPRYVQILSNAKISIIQLLWTEFGQAVDFYVQSLSKRSWTWHRFDRALTRLGQQWDRFSTWPVFGQTFDMALTLFGQRLDFLSSPCPTIQRKLVPSFYRYIS